MKRAALVALLLVASCKKKATSDLYAQLRRDLCGCTDLACIETVTKLFRDKYGLDPSKATPENASDMAQIYECITKVAGTTATPDAAAPVASVPATPPKREADALINAARTWQKDPKLVISEVTISYVEANGMLDATHGILTIAFGVATRRADDPNRKTGAPVVEDTERPTECPNIASMPGTGWSPYVDTCRDAPPYIAKCTVEAIWQRAIKAGAPKDAVAVITFKNTDPPFWRFAITDEPRGVHIAHEFPDDCERTLEKPQ